MGIVNSQQMSQTDKYVQVKKISDNKTLLKCLENDSFILSLESTFASTQQLQLYQQQLNKRKGINHQHYLSQLEHHIVTSSNICSKQYRLIQLYPYESYTLWQEVESRSTQKRGFSWKEIWSILCSCVLAISHLSRNEIIHYTLSPCDIILNAEGHLSDYIFDYTIHHQFYYSPEMLKAIKSSSSFSINNKSGVFILAITILHLIYLKPMTYLYNFQQLSVDNDEIARLIDKVFDNDIRHILKKMVKVASYQRITFTQLQEMLYGILERKNTQTQQLQRLEGSICRVYPEEVNIKPLSHELSFKPKQVQIECINMVHDEQDIGNQSSDIIQKDIQKIDEKECLKFTLNEQYNALYDKTNSEFIRTEQQQQQQNYQYRNSAVKNIQKRQNLSIRKEKLISISTKTEKSGQQYVTQQYNKGKYEGYKEGGLRHGFGTFFYHQGGKYCGNWVRNKMQGRGALYYKSGNIAYEGEWKKDQLHNYGVLYNQVPDYFNHPYDWKFLNNRNINNMWVKYQGNFKQDLRNGEGTLYLANGQYYKGLFKNDAPQGEGFYKNLQGIIIAGKWKEGLYIQPKNK